MTSLPILEEIRHILVVAQVALNMPGVYRLLSDRLLVVSLKSCHSLGGKQEVIDGFWPGVAQSRKAKGSVQCVACEYAGCIWIVVVVVPTVTAMTDSSSTDKTMIVFMFP